MIRPDPLGDFIREITNARDDQSRQPTRQTSEHGSPRAAARIDHFLRNGRAE